MRLPTIIHCYLLMHCLEDGPVAAVIMANVVANVANLMSISDTRTTLRLYLSIKREHIDRVSGS